MLSIRTAVLRQVRWDGVLGPHPTALPRRGKTRSGVDMLHWRHEGKRKVLWSAGLGPCKRQALHLHCKQWKAGTQSRSQGVAKSWRILRLHFEMIPRHPVQYAL